MISKSKIQKEKDYCNALLKREYLLLSKKEKLNNIKDHIDGILFIIIGFPIVLSSLAYIMPSLMMISAIFLFLIILFLSNKTEILEVNFLKNKLLNIEKELKKIEDKKKKLFINSIRIENNYDEYYKNIVHKKENEYKGDEFVQEIIDFKNKSKINFLKMNNLYKKIKTSKDKISSFYNRLFIYMIISIMLMLPLSICGLFLFEASRESFSAIVIFVLCAFFIFISFSSAIIKMYQMRKENKKLKIFREDFLDIQIFNKYYVLTFSKLSKKEMDVIDNEFIEEILESKKSSENAIMTNKERLEVDLKRNGMFNNVVEEQELFNE